ncbi:MAG: NAD(P)-dependent oxidoreductase [Rhizonema sp. NSF051]|nr:NAD(P)-dependent oxidoreductase [Rhizonema sp. NSF051]
MTEHVGFIGLGNMGLPMAGNLIEAGYTLKVYNRTPEKAEPLVKRGAKLVSHPQEVAEPGGIVITMLSNDEVVADIVSEETGMLAHLGSGGIHVSMSTLAPATAHQLAEHHQQHGVTYIAAPVFGPPEAAAARKLWIYLSGSQAAKERVQPLMKALGQGVFDFGEEVGAANVVKLAGNFLLGAAIEAMAEAFAFAEKNGIERTKIADTIAHTLFACPAYERYGKLIAQHNHETPYLKLSLGLKDNDLVLQTAAASKTPMPLASMLHDRFISAIAKGRADLDWTALSLGASEDAGLSMKGGE